jgi:hypothetical protein
VSAEAVEVDPFGTAALRAGVLAAWADSPTRFREDANAEEDLRLGGYADTWFVELAQNAADAARAAAVPGRLRVAAVDGELWVANTGAPLGGEGVAALASLRASAKRDDPGSVGRFGVGFSAVLALSDAPRVVGTTGGVAFSATATADAVRELPGPAAELARRDGQLPVLRLVWPTGPEEPPVPAGYATEVRLPLRPGVDPEALLAAAAAGAPDLLLALPDLVEIALDDPERGASVLRRVEFGHVEATLPAESRSVSSTAPRCEVVAVGERRWLLARGAVAGTVDVATEQRGRHVRSLCWALPLTADGHPDPLTDDVLHAPTATAERLSLPARLIADVPLDPDRRRVRPGPGTDAVLRAAATTYLDLVAALAPAARLALVPPSGFPRSEPDGLLHALILDALRATPWLPAATGVEVAPARATVLDLPAPELPDLLADLVPGLLEPLPAEWWGGLPAELGVHRLGAAELADLLLGLERPPGWWRAVYAALEPAVDLVPRLLDELRGLPVPLADGRTVAGPASVLLPSDAEAGRLGALALPGLHVAAPQAVHPLLVRLGATPAGPAALLDHPALRDAVERSVDDADAGLDRVPLAEAVLGLVGELGPGGAAGRNWLAALALTDDDGDPARADELMLADAALRPLLADDAPLAVLGPEWERRAARDVLVAVGIVDGFTVVADDDPCAHDLDDVDRWMDEVARPDGQEGPPEVVDAVRDLDLVSGDAWPAALALLAAERDTRAAVLAPGSYPAWWLARHVRLHGHRPGHWRLPSAVDLAALYDPLPGAAGGEGDVSALSAAAEGAGVHLAQVGADDAVLAAVGVRATLAVVDARDAADLLARLADPHRHPDAALVLAAHAALAEAVDDGRLDPADLDPPRRVRALDGTVADAGDAAVLDLPWLAPVLAPAEVVAGGDPRTLADLLDLPLASEMVDADVPDGGRPVPWSALPEVVVTCHTLGVPVPAGELRCHERLEVLLHRPVTARRHVPTWRDADGRWHGDDPVRALLAVLAASSDPA